MFDFPTDAAQFLLKLDLSFNTKVLFGLLAAMYRFQDEEKLDLIVIVECTLVNSTLVKRAKTQLLHLVDMIHNRGLNLQMALVSYKDHPRQKLFLSRLGNSPGQSAEKIAHCQGFTNEKDTMKTWIRELRGQGRGSTRGLADGLEVALKLVVGGSGGGVHEIKGRDDAIKICLLLRKYRGSEKVNRGLKPFIPYSAKSKN